MIDSTAVSQTVKIVRLVVKFHPLLTVTNLIFGVIFLYDWIEEEVSNQWKFLKVYCHSTMRALLDPITEKMKNLSKSLQMHFNNEAAKGQLKAKLIGKLTLFSAAYLLLDTQLSSEYDQRGVKTHLLLLVGLDLLTRSKVWSELRILHGSCGLVANSTSNFTFFILALIFAKFYDNSLRSLSSVLCIAVFFLCLLVVLRPRTDLGLFSFIIGVIGSITYNCYKFMFPTWIIASICFVLFIFKSWIDKYWLDLDENPSTNTTARSTNVFFLFSSTAALIAQAIFTSFAIESPMSDYKKWLVKASKVVLWSVRFNKVYINPKDSSLPSTNNKGISGFISIVINVAQGIFWFAFTIYPVANYKDRLFAVISYVVFCFWVQSLFHKDLSPFSTSTKGIIGTIWSLLSTAKYGIVVLAGLEPHVHYREWLIAAVCYVLWWVRLRTSFPKDLLQSTIFEFKAQLWWTVVLYSIIIDVISWIQLFTTTHHQQQG